MRGEESPTEDLNRNTTIAAAATPSKEQTESSTTQNLNTKKSLRNLIRPSPASDHDANRPGLPAMKPPSAVQPRKSSTSLFNLFSKPKVEKARGYGGEGPAPRAPSKPLPPLKSALKTSPPSAPPSSPPPPPQTISTPKEDSPQKADTLPLQTHLEVSTREDRVKEGKPGVWVTPPLFQAFARSIKTGLAEVITNTAIDKSASARPKTVKDKGERSSMDSSISADTKKTKIKVKASNSNSGLSVEKQQKIIVLMDTGHILQYSPHGATDRMPEKILALCQDSAAMTCDVASGQLNGMRVIQSVTHKPFSLVHTFSRLTRRSNASKRDTPSLILVFAEPQEMDDWLRAVRSKIAELCRPTSSKDTPTQRKVDSVIGDTTRLSEPAMPSPPAPAPPPPQPAAEKSVALRPMLITVPDRRASLAPQSPPPRQTSFDDLLDDDTPGRKGSLEMLEDEVEKLMSSQAVNGQDPGESKRSSDAQSYASSDRLSGEQYTLNNLRNSARMSYLSGITSGTSSLTSEPSSNQTSAENIVDNAASTKSSYRSMSSFQSSKRRSVMPVMPTSHPISELPASFTSLLVQTGSTTGALSKPSHSPPATVTTKSQIVSSSQTLTALPEVQSSIILKNPTPPIAEEDERPQSILTDLPPPSTWTSKPPPKNRHTFVGPPMTDRQLQRMSSAPVLQNVPSQQQSNRRASQAFRMPLKVNPDTPATRPPSRKKSDRMSSSSEASRDEPKVYTLEAKIDPRTQRMSMGPATYSSAEMRARSTQRLSLFPSSLMSQDTFTEDSRHTPVNTMTSTNPEGVPPRRASLQRPASLQVRSDHAPFLSSVRSSTQPSPPDDKPSQTLAPAPAPPIRSLKPSRSSSAISSLQSTDPLQTGRNLMSETVSTVHQPRRLSYVSKRSPSPASGPPRAPLPVTPAVSSPNSFAAQQRVYQRHTYMPRTSMMTSLPALDFGIPTLGLGPPAPPPNAPLPAPPGGAPPGILSRGTTPTPLLGSRSSSTTSVVMQSRSGSISNQGAGLGIQVGT